MFSEAGLRNANEPRVPEPGDALRLGSSEGRVADFALLCREGLSPDETQEATGCGHTHLQTT